MSDEPRNGDEHFETELLTDPHHLRKDMRLVAQAIQEGRIDARRWNTSVTQEELHDRIRKDGGMHKLSIRERCVFAIFEGLASTSIKYKMTAGALAATIEAQNQRDELAALATGLDPLNIEGVPQSPLEIMQSMNATIPLLPDQRASG